MCASRDVCVTWCVRRVVCASRDVCVTWCVRHVVCASRGVQRQRALVWRTHSTQPACILVPSAASVVAYSGSAAWVYCAGQSRALSAEQSTELRHGVHPSAGHSEWHVTHLIPHAHPVTALAF
eukprot:62541-Rhodomonas_salina.1